MTGSSRQLLLLAALLLPVAYGMTGLKLLPQLVVIALFALQVMLHCTRPMGVAAGVLRGLLLSGLAFAGVGSPAFELLMRLAPAQTAAGHPTMPIAQGFFALLAALVAGGAALLLYCRRWRHRAASRLMVQAVLDLALVALTGAALLDWAF